MARLRSRTNFPATIRRLVALALAPAACGGLAVVPSASDGGGQDATQGGNPPIYDDDSSVPDATDAPTADSSDGGVGSPERDADAGDAADAGDTGIVCDGCDGGYCYACRDTFDAGSGACAARRLSGNMCTPQEDVLFPCGLPAPNPVVSYQGGNFQCYPYCGSESWFWNCWVVTEAGALSFPAYSPQAAEAGTGPIVVHCSVFCGNGRLPGAMVGAPTGCATTMGAALADMAFLEAAAVRAFLDLATQLRSLGAPASLIRRARRAARDEMRHARVMSALARSHGHTVPEPRAVPSDVVDPFAIALLNAREGCVRETWGAAYAVVQSRRASDWAVRRAMKAIARDEIAHATLSRDIAAWIEPRLTSAQRLAVNAERRRAVAELEAELRREADDEASKEMRAALGLPSGGEARSLFSAMRAELWAEVA